jgi:hypothetical protein
MVAVLVSGGAVSDEHTAALLFLQRCTGFMYILFGGLIYLLFFRTTPSWEFKLAYFRWVGVGGLLYLVALGLLIVESPAWVPVAVPLVAIGVLLTCGRTYWLIRYGRSA